MKATIYERGNGFCETGDYVSDGDRVYRVTSMDQSIQTGRPGEGNSVSAEVELADWADLTDAEADAIICAVCVED